MAKGDIRLFQSQNTQGVGSRINQVASGAAASINAGEPVSKALAGSTVAAMATSKPVIATDFVVGIAATTSTDTAAAAGTVEVWDLVPGQVWLIAPKTAATWNTTALYNALVGARCTIDLTTGSYTLNASDGATNGCVVQDLPETSITKFSGKVAFSFRNAASPLT